MAADEERERGQWYTNRDLFEMIQQVNGRLMDSMQTMQTQMTALSAELARTTEAVRRYNGLREQLAGHERRLAAIELRAAGAASVGRGIREWGGWLVALGSLAVAVVSLMRR